MASFNDTLAHEILAGSDFLVIPSRFEPCGIVGLAAVRYGTLPIAPALGGLRELVQGATSHHGPILRVTSWAQWIGLDFHQ